MAIFDRPFVAAILKPKLGMSPNDVAKVCYEAALGGVGLIKDDYLAIVTVYTPTLFEWEPNFKTRRRTCGQII